MTARLIALVATAFVAGCATPAATTAAPPSPAAKAAPSRMPPPAKEARRVSGPGAYAWTWRCQGCHDPATPGAPTLARLETYRPDAIVSALMVGKMKLIAPGMEETEARDIAAWVTSEAMPQKGAMPAARP